MSKKFFIIKVNTYACLSAQVQTNGYVRMENHENSLEKDYRGNGQ